MTNTSTDLLHRFIFSEQHIRGEIVQLGTSLSELFSTANYPTVVKQLLAQMASAATLLSATLKFEGDISLQIQGKGAVNYAVVNATNELTYRGVARWNEQDEVLPSEFSELCADSVLVITLTPNEGERYQGVVALDKPTLAACIENYFAQSEQLLTRIYLFSDANKAAGLLLQVLPQDAQATQVDSAEAFHHFATLTDTLTCEEILSLSTQTILHRLYHEHDIELFNANKVSYLCSCSKQRSAAALLHVEKAELLAIIEEQGHIEMKCQYCNRAYLFDAIDVETVHANTGSVDTVNNTAH